MREITLDHKDGSGSSLRLRMLDLESSDKVCRNSSKCDALQSIERTVGHVIDHVDDVIMIHKLTHNVSTNETATTSY
jgi:hypothetical protein